LEVGFVKIVYTERVQDGVERLGYSVGLEALKSVQKQENLLWKVSEVLTSPIDKLDKTAEKIVKELKEVNVEKRKLTKELAKKESVVDQSKTAEASIEVGGISIVERDFREAIDINRMLQTSSEIIKRNDAAVTLFYGTDGKSCRLMIMAGELAVKKGVNAGNIMKKVAPIFGGGGDGRPNFAQGGGTKLDKLREALKAAEDAVKKQVKL
jgi:alanyl-tRNA synthetase